MKVDISIDTLEFHTQPLISSRVFVDQGVLTVRVSRDNRSGLGECCPVEAYGHTCSTTRAEIMAFVRSAVLPLTPQYLLRTMRPTPGRNALEGAILDLAYQETGRTVWSLVGVDPISSLACTRTIVHRDPAGMRADAELQSDWPILKVKLGSDGDEERLVAVRGAAPNSRLIVDANGGWSRHQFEALIPTCLACGVELIEQPLAVDDDANLVDMKCPIPLAADESFRGLGDLSFVAERYDFVNLKLDKFGGLTSCLEIAAIVKDSNLGLIAGCLVGTSLSVASAFALGAMCDYVDLDSVLLLSKDPYEAVSYSPGRLHLTRNARWCGLDAAI